MIYLDHNATSPLREEVQAAMRAVEGLPLNASSVHAMGRKAKQMLEGARKALAEYVSVFPHEIVFTASATEANNSVLRAFAHTRALFVSAVEHPCVLNTALKLGGNVLEVDGQGIVKLDALDAKLSSLNAPALVSVMLVNNETGAIQPIAEIAAIAHKYQAKLHVDAVQGFGKMPIDMGLFGADMLTLSAHKAGGPIGVGALILRDDKGFIPLLTGGGQERGLRAGTENIPAIMGLKQLVEISDVASMQAMRENWQKLRANFLADILQIAPDARLYGADDARTMPNVMMLGMPGMSSETQLMHFDLAGIAISAGSACSSGKITPSHVLRAMGVPVEQAGQAVRISLGHNSTAEELNTLKNAWFSLYTRSQAKAAS